ncbi:ubiquitin carboxyl-terminal hydrolase 26 [Impatiens glandulifera]|uniref:ubiquitin carboxyl-terminal hydrolase 26 n=1 Tax=Impatiens glandulifera TaxID=253017 RepID=UPI001FB15873|nr:ubiquitin carboxyl-terminal hydrolase 26 [Impatiens glandulifera]
MSRLTTRGKNKRHRKEDDTLVTNEIFRRIHSIGTVTEEDVNNLYMLLKPVCHGCRVNTKDNPNCFCGLVPPPNGSRKSGLWQKTSELFTSMGSDPSCDLRSSTDIPAGLTNMGATCYANSILQSLYMNKRFREGIFAVEPDVLERQPVLDQLSRLFAQLCVSKMTIIDSGPFIKALELDNGVQQDSHEFLTLFFSLLEQCLSCSRVPNARTIVQDLFRGSLSHVTTCSKCRKESEASSKLEDIYGLELNVKGLKSLEESLDDYFNVEKLEGDNQYYCESCTGRVDATRSIKLRSLPPVLNFQLKRCVFLPKTTTRKKITSAFCFPEKLDMKCRMSEHSQLELIYELAAVLIHKGPAVNTGHYVAHVKDENTGMWWEFDDDLVSSLGGHPFGGSSSAAKPVSNDSVSHQSGSEKFDTLPYKKHTDAIDSKSSESNGSSVQMFSSNDAYMLMYILRQSKHGEKGTKKVSPDDASLPPHIYEEITQFNALFTSSCEEYKSKKEILLNAITQQRQEVRLVLLEAPVRSTEEPFFWISTDWLRHWADNITPVTIDNSSIQCCHGKVPVSKTGLMKRLSAKAWTTLYLKYGGGPVLSNNEYCETCLLDCAHSMASADTYRDRKGPLVELAEAAMAGNCKGGPLYYVSKIWLQQWLRRKNTDSPCEADTGPTAPIKCPHGELMPDQATGAKRVVVPENLWLFFYDIANEVKPDDLSGCYPFPSNSKPCGQCSLELSEVASLEDNLREFKQKQRQNHERLVLGKGLILVPHQIYYLLPSSWLVKWKSYVTASGKAASAFAEPENFKDVIDSLKCQKHSRLNQRPPDLICKRGVVQQKSPSVDGITIITENDWKLFCEIWDCSVEDGVSAEIEESLDSCPDFPISVENYSAPHETNGEIELIPPVLKTSPVVCGDCISDRESCELMKKLNYYNEDICVCFIRGKEQPPKSVLEASTPLEPDRRTSKRSRKTAFGNSINLNVSGSTSVYQLKMMIWESFGVVKENQILHKGSRVIDKESATLADLNIFPGDILWVKDSEVHENRDIADEIVGDKLGVEKAEEGFRGSLLTSNTSSSTQVIQEEAEVIQEEAEKAEETEKAEKAEEADACLE